MAEMTVVVGLCGNGRDSAMTPMESDESFESIYTQYNSCLKYELFFSSCNTT